MKNIFVLSCSLLLFVSCISNKGIIKKQLDKKLSSPFYKNQFTGVLVIDALTKDTLYNHSSEKYFTPASNTKIFTLYTALKNLPDSIPALSYLKIRDTTYFKGTGDPSFLHPYLKDSTALRFLSSQENLVYVTGTFENEKYGTGWAWDDYQWYYSPERNALPIHGNVVLAYKNPELTITPSYFKDSVLQLLHKNNRNETNNIFYYPPQSSDTLETPFITSDYTTVALLEQYLSKKIKTQLTMPVGKPQLLSGIEADSLYVRMMHESDNFIAEQLLLLSSYLATDTLNSERIRTRILESELKGLAQTPRWVDGSGLSRYNLFTPQNMVFVLDQLYGELPLERLFHLFPSVDLSKTLVDNSTKNEPPFVYAKSGSLSNNYCLSGYLRTSSGRILIFSFMNNHFRNSTADVRLQLGQILQTLRENY